MYSRQITIARRKHAAFVRALRHNAANRITPKMTATFHSVDVRRARVSTRRDVVHRGALNRCDSRGCDVRVRGPFA
jgi:hypothetical protein